MAAERILKRGIEAERSELLCRLKPKVNYRIIVPRFLTTKNPSRFFGRNVPFKERILIAKHTKDLKQEEIVFFSLLQRPLSGFIRFAAPHSSVSTFPG